MVAGRIPADKRAPSFVPGDRASGVQQRAWKSAMAAVEYARDLKREKTT